MQQPNNSCSAATRCDVPSKYPPNHVQMDVHGAVSPIKSRITVAQPKYNIYDSNRTVTKEELEAMEEHANISTCTGDLSSIRKEYGRGIFVYFKYLWYLALVDLVLAVFSVILYVTAVSSNGGLDTRIYDGLDLLFLASFPHGVKGVWYAMSALGIFVAFMAAPLYKRYENRISSFWHGEDRLEEDYVEEEDVIEENRAYTSRQRSTRRIISALAFAVICVVQGFVTYGLHELLSGSDNQITAQILAAAVAAMKMLWKFLSKYMTRFEKHRRKRDYYEWDTGKVFFMRMANVLGLYLTKYLAGEDNIDPAQCKNINSQNDCGCPLAAMGQQFFWLIIFEISAANLIEIAIPFLMLHWKRRKQLKSGHGDEEMKQKFDLTEEYTEVLYRQFIIYIGMIVFPLITVVGAISYVLEYWLDKYRLIYLARKPLTKPAPVRAKVVFFFHFIAAAAALVSFPNGLGFLFAGLDIKSCAFW